MPDRGRLRCSAAGKLVWLRSSATERGRLLVERGYKNLGRWRRSRSAERSVRGEEDWGGGSGENSSLTLSLSSGSVAGGGGSGGGGSRLHLMRSTALFSFLSHFIQVNTQLEGGKVVECVNSRPLVPSFTTKKKKRKRPSPWNQKKKRMRCCRKAAAFKFCMYDWFVN